MSWVTPISRAFGYLITQGNWNADVVDNTKYLKGQAGTIVYEGAQSNPVQPAFLAYNSATDTNQTGNGAVATVDFDAEVFDQAGNFASDAFTAPITSRYLFAVQVVASDLTVAMKAIALRIVTSNRTYVSEQDVNVETAGDIWTITMTVLADMDAGDTATVTLQISGGAGDTADIFGTSSPATFFSGYLAC